MTDGLLEILSKEGLKGLYSGYVATAFRDAPFAGIYVLIYEQLKGLIGTNLVNEKRTTFINLSSGMAAGLLATMITQPFDLVKTKLQLRPEHYTSTLHAFKMVVASEGIQGLYTGLVPRLFRKTLSSAITWTVYEELIRRSNKDRIKY